MEVLNLSNMLIKNFKFKNFFLSIVNKPLMGNIKHGNRFPNRQFGEKVTGNKNKSDSFLFKDLLCQSHFQSERERTSALENMNVNKKKSLLWITMEVFETNSGENFFRSF